MFIHIWYANITLYGLYYQTRKNTLLEIFILFKDRRQFGMEFTESCFVSCANLKVRQQNYNKSSWTCRLWHPKICYATFYTVIVYCDAVVPAGHGLRKQQISENRKQRKSNWSWEPQLTTEITSPAVATKYSLWY